VLHCESLVAGVAGVAVLRRKQRGSE
jgi:hypothetical protein